ncbi:hypothetical protein BJX66DRAFT_314435 [Aspergillus keveii]|uniref:Uncharacterized protein n=1 Tax=Aspergillus keveii TaxID=714993 RepID=A0ABR4FQU1_9EURO
MEYMEFFANATKVVMNEALKYEVAPRLFLHAVGFGQLGPIAGSWAAWIQSCYGSVPAHGMFAFFQRLGMTCGSVWAPRGLSFFFVELFWRMKGAFCSFMPSWFDDVFTSWMPAFFRDLGTRSGGFGLGME